MRADMAKFDKVVVLDTVIFFPEQEALLKSMVNDPVIERVPLVFDRSADQWTLPEGYELPDEANIVMWPSSLPESIADLPVEIHERLGGAHCWATGPVGEAPAHDLLARVEGADCILTSWTAIPDDVLDAIAPRAILTWTHEHTGRLDVERARERGIFTDCVPDYATDAVAELQLDFLTELIVRNKETHELARTEDDLIIGVLRHLFDRYRLTRANETRTRRGRFAHEFHRLGHAAEKYGSLRGRDVDTVIGPRQLEGKTVAIVDPHDQLAFLHRILEDGFRMRVTREISPRPRSARFYKLLTQHDTVLFDSRTLQELAVAKILACHADAVDLQMLQHMDETLVGKTIGIVGLGRIGTRVAEIARVLGMRVQYTGPRRKAVPYSYVELDELMATSDVISVNVACHEADGLISAEMLDRTQPGTYFLNASDGRAVDIVALSAKMVSDDLLCGLDVYPGLPTTGTLGLDADGHGKIKRQLPNHVLTYRAGWITQEAIEVKTAKLLGHMFEVLYLRSEAEAETALQAAG